MLSSGKKEKPSQLLVGQYVKLALMYYIHPSKGPFDVAEGRVLRLKGSVTPGLVIFKEEAADED